MSSKPETQNSKLKILLIEDNPEDARLIELMLKRANVRFELQCVERLSAGIERLQSANVDIILLDLDLPDSKGLVSLAKLNDIRPEAPVIVLTGLADDTIGLQAVKEGAQDYLIKGQADKNLLSRSINYSIERKKAEEALKLNKDRLEALLELTMMKVTSEKEITDFALEEGVRLTRSEGGYLHFFNEDEQTIQLYSWSKDVLKTCTAAKDEHYPLDKAGVWADSVRFKRPVIHNEYQNLAEKKGYPEGHFHLVRHLGVPIFDKERIVGVMGVGNKEEPYNEIDAIQINLFMNSMWRILKQKRNEEEREKLIRELREALAHVKTLSGMLPICAYCKKIRDDKGYWNQIESYIRDHSEAEFSHGMCPECAEKAMKEIEEFKKRSGR